MRSGPEPRAAREVKPQPDGQRGPGETERVSEKAEKEGPVG